MENGLSEKNRKAILAEHSQRVQEVTKAAEQLGWSLRPIVADSVRQIKAQRFPSIVSNSSDRTR